MTNLTCTFETKFTFRMQTKEQLEKYKNHPEINDSWVINLGLREEGKKMKPDELQKDIVEASNLALKDGMGTDELVITLLSNAVIAAKHLGLSKDFCLGEFHAAIEDIYNEEEEDEKGECCEKETHQASPEMKLFFEKLLDLKSFVVQQSSGQWRHTSFEAQQLFYEVYRRLNEIIKEKK